MLDRAGDADRDIDFRRDDLAGLADLIIVRDIAGIDCRTRSADAGAELVGERLDQAVEVLAILESPTTRDDDLGRGQLGTLRLGYLRTGEGRETLVAGCRNLLDGAC